MHRVEKQRVRSSRSRPVSCHFCRSRKLKCSRTFPCTNCTSRGKTCQFYPDTLLPASTQYQTEELSSNDTADILVRLRRLEEIVITNGQASSPLGQTTTQASSLPSPPVPKPNQPYMVDEGQPSAAAVTWLEGEITSSGSTVGLNQNHARSTADKNLQGNLFKSEIEFRTCPIRNAVASESMAHQAQPTKRCIWLPLREEAKIIVEKYITEVTFLHHVVTAPSLRTMVDELYCDLRESKPVKIGYVSLLLSILASTTSFWTEHDMCNPVFSTPEEAFAQSTHWVRLTLEVIDYSRYKHLESIQDIQAMVIITFVATSIVGITSQVRHIFSIAISFGRGLSLHRIDHPHNSNLDVPSPSSAEAEIGRRVWWYIVASDW